MFNLSDKELDRLSREAASEHDPGEPMGAGSWPMLEQALDKELGKPSPSPNPLRGFRRISLYFAPAVILLVGVSYYFIKQGKSNPHSTAAAPATPLINQTESSGSPPAVVIKMEKPGSTQKETTIPNQNNSDKSNSTPDNNRRTEPNSSSTPPTRPASAPSRAIPGGGSAARVGSAAAPANMSGSALSHRLPGSKAASDHASASASATTTAPSTAPASRVPSGAASASHLHRPSAPAPGSATDKAPATVSTPRDLTGARTTGIHTYGGSKKPFRHPGKDRGDRNLKPGDSVQSGATSAGQDQATVHHASEPALSAIRKPSSLTGKAPVVDDSALRNTTSKAVNNSLVTINIGKKNSQSLHIDRSLQLGFAIAPDFASVNSLAGDKPGISVGLTADYQFANRWYIGTGLLYSKRNYSARAEDYHVPPNYYQMNYMHDVNFIKGSFSMLEIPLNLRYDFSVAGNTTFFASGGLSTYLLSHENCDYYYSFFGREVYRKFSYQGDRTHLFSVINLSMGVETGISNSFSLLLAPYMKIPAGKLGFGQVQMNSIGINFALKYAPVLKRKRH